MSLPRYGRTSPHLGDAPLDTRNMSQSRRVVGTAVERNSWGKSRGDLMCRFPDMGGLHRTSGDAPLDTRNMSQSRVDQKGHFPNTGGLHQNPGYTPHNTRNMTQVSLRSHAGTKPFHATSIIKPGTTITPIVGDIEMMTHSPSWCHVNQSLTPSSKRTRAAASAYKGTSHKSSPRFTKHKRCNNAIRKHYKQVRFLKEVQVCNIASNSNVQYLNTENIKHNSVVCDGGDMIDDAIEPDILRSDVQVLRIRNGDLWVADTGNAALGLRFTSPIDKRPIFVRLPRNNSLGILNDGRSVCSAMRSCTSTQRQSLVRGNQNHVFIEKNIINTAVLVHSREELNRVSNPVSTG